MSKHRNFLYALVFILLILQAITFFTLSSQVNKVNTELDKAKSGIADLGETQDAYNALYRENFNLLSNAISSQEEELNKQIGLLKSASGDFTEVIEKAVLSVVSVVTPQGIGSGFFVTNDGYVVTNFHVIANQANPRVLTYNKDFLPAEIIGADVFKDLALLKVEGNFEPIELGESEDVQVGNQVIAIGNPLGLQFSVTDGIVSGVHRAGPNGQNEYIQTDVSLNPGNSGGPLINKQGKVVGINNFKIGGTEGLGFALESDPIREIINGIANKTIIN